MSSKKNDKLRVAWIITSAAAIVILIVYFVKLNGIYREKKENMLQEELSEADNDGISFASDEADFDPENPGFAYAEGEKASGDNVPQPQKTDSPEPDEDGSGLWTPETDNEEGTFEAGEAELTDEAADIQDSGNGSPDGETEKTGEDDHGEEEPVKTEDGISYVNEYGLDPSKPMVALSFDDGPGMYTERILELLAEYDAHATFFMVGYNIDEYPEVVKAVYESGNEIGNHSINHPNLKELSEAEIKKELNGNQDKINSACGAELNCIVRPPYGSYNDKVKANCPHPMILWSVDTLDWSSRNAQEVLKEVKKQTNDGCIILCHDIYKSTMEAVELYLPWLVEQGYQVCTVSQMYKSRGEFQKDGHVYSHTMTAEEFLARQADAKTE